MVTFQKLSVAFLAVLASIRVFIEGTSNEVRTQERGDVPGWVMLAIMSALLVAGLLAIAGPRLIQLFNQAIDNVAGLG
ncbi:hypothetical protein [Neomicrococcus lactis]|uniref:Uncharacterized protein n=1 Tax=Neomicrococcus lactis TaxID=732241 RepID=A0A7W8YAC9_9MICC|nr:hypothetical protein [Neomicrococcus lactis]MBB5597898.1 hypothetical protein [Neomicrococcus lactis]